MISVINETRRSKLRRLLHDENEQKVNKVWNTGIEGEFRESLGVPPASSDHHCWWLDDCEYLILAYDCRLANVEKAHRGGLLCHSRQMG